MAIKLEMGKRRPQKSNTLTLGKVHVNAIMLMMYVEDYYYTMYNWYYEIIDLINKPIYFDELTMH